MINVMLWLRPWLSAAQIGYCKKLNLNINDGEVCYNDRNKSVAFELVQGRKATLEKLQNEGK